MKEKEYRTVPGLPVCDRMPLDLCGTQRIASRRNSHDVEISKEHCAGNASLALVPLTSALLKNAQVEVLIGSLGD
jgi:hypothetical protein